MITKHLFLEILSENEKLLENKKNQLQRAFKASEIEGKAVILTGVRRSGKSTLARQFIDQLKNSKKNHVLYLNFVDERLRGCKAEDLQYVLPAFYELNPDENLNIYFLLDEIQVIEGWEFWVDRLLRNHRYKVIITGSNSKLLSQEIGTTMRGRSLAYEIFPFSFEEILRWKKIKPDETAAKKGILSKEFKKYLIHGGFPETVFLNTLDRIRVLQEYREVMLYRDIYERHKPDPSLTNSLVQLMLGQFASLVTLNKSVEKLKAQGMKATKENISELFRWLQEPYLFFFVPMFSESLQKQQVNPKKIYLIDTGLIVANHSGILSNTGRLLENSVFIHLRRNYKKIFYWKDEKGREVDFFINGNILIQVCMTLQDDVARSREIIALQSAMRFFKIKQSQILTLDDDAEDIKVNEGKISILPAWKWMLK